MKGSIYSSFVAQLARYQGERYPFHVGDTWMEPAEGCRMEDLSVAAYPGMHRYAPPGGLPRLVELLVKRTSARTGVAFEARDVLVTAGCTGALAAVAGAMLDPGDEVLILAPHWPLIAGIVRANKGVPVRVPVLGLSEPGAICEAVARHVSARTVALYVNTPNNPTGRRLGSDALAGLADLARHKGLWLLSDEVYEDYDWGGEHLYLASLAPERTLSVYSFSKGFGMAGNRLGYVAGPSDFIGSARKIATHTFYSAPTSSQLAAIRLLEGPADAWVVMASERYAAVGREAAQRLGQPEPEGSTFLFLDVASCLDETGLDGLLRDAVSRGLLLAPGPSFGPYPTHLRLCFTSTAPEITLRGVDRLAELLNERGGLP
jgi:N-succinyldiaminopimelate aminotransferase